MAAVTLIVAFWWLAQNNPLAPCAAGACKASLATGRGPVLGAILMRRQVHESGPVGSGVDPAAFTSADDDLFASAGFSWPAPGVSMR